MTSSRVSGTRPILPENGKLWRRLTVSLIFFDTLRADLGLSIAIYSRIDSKSLTAVEDQ